MCARSVCARVPSCMLYAVCCMLCAMLLCCMRVPRWPSHCRRKTSWYCGRSIETVENKSSRLADAIFVATRTTSSREASTGVCCASARTSLIRLTAVGESLSVKLLLEAMPAWLGSPRRSACRCFEACRADACRRGGAEDIATFWGRLFSEHNLAS